MMHFLYPSLAAGFVLVAAPLIVHLINMLRHRRQQWAAMEFLLVAYRKQRKWVILRQLLLLALRTLAMLLLVAMLAGWVSGSRLLDALGGNTQHHLVILDDSFSMEDRSGGNAAYQTALMALEGFVQRLTEDEGSHQLTVLRTSRAALAARAGITSGDSVTDLSGQTVTGGSRELTRVMATSPTPLAVGLEPALELAAKLVEFADADQTHVYVLSDLREDQWRSGRTMAALFAEIARQGADIKLIDCAVKSGQNLAVTELKPLGDVWAAGVPARVSVRVHNYSDQAVTDLAVSTAVVRYGAQVTQNADQPQSGVVESLPDVLFERIEPNADAVKVFQVFIDEPVRTRSR